MLTRPLRAAALLVVTGTFSASARAQAAAAPGWSTSRNACLDAIPDSAMRRVPVYLTARLVDSSGARVPVRDGIALLTQAVAQTGQRLLASTEGTLPEAEPSIDWRGLDGEVVVLAHRTGRIEGRITPPRQRGDVGVSDAGVRLVARALDTAVADGERLVFPDSLPADAVSWSFHLEAAVLSEKGEITPPKIRVGAPIFSVLVPAERQVAAERVRVSYPPRLRSAGFMGNLVMQFVVDTTGQVDRATIHDLYPAGAAALDADGRPIYDEFVRSIRQALVTARYRPARVGGCLVRQLVQQPFQFKLDDGRWQSP